MILRQDLLTAQSPSRLEVVQLTSEVPGVVSVT